MPYFESNRSKLYYRTIGSGPPVVLILALLTMVGVECAHLMGSSMGAMIALEYVSIRPEKVKSLIFSSLPIQKPSGSFETFVSDLNLALQNGSRETFLQTLASYLFSSNFLRDEQFGLMADFLAKSPIDHRPETIFCQLRAIRKWLNLKRWTIGCDCSCMMIFGSEDKLVPVKNIMDLTSQFFPYAAKKIIEGAGHAAHIERPKQFNKIVCDFFQSQTC